MGLRTMRRRRREHKTDYKQRLNLLKAETDRIVIRRTNKYYIIQTITSNEAQDKTLQTTSSKELLQYGWKEEHKGSLKSIPAGYLTGLLHAKKTKKGTYIIDLGMARTIHGTRIFAAIQGLKEGGLQIKAKEKALPTKERIQGEHQKEELQNTIKTTKEKILNK